MTIALLRPLADRDVRQRSLVPPEPLAACHPLVIGVGAIGRQVALQLAALGVSRLTLYDADIVETENLAPQGYWPVDLGLSKVAATAQRCRQLQPELAIHAFAERFRRSSLRQFPATPALAVFCCVDSITTRKMVWESVRDQAAFFVDGRMSAEVIRVLASSRPATDEDYATSLFAVQEAFAGACTAQSTIYTASIAAGLMLSQFTRWLREVPIEPDLLLNLLASELTLAGSSNR